MTTPNGSYSEGQTTRLRELLQAYGRNPLRWPEDDRRRFARLLREPSHLPVEEACDAAIIDKALDLAGPVPVPEPRGAKQRLLERVRAHNAATSAHPGYQGVAVPALAGWQRAMAAGIMVVALVGGIMAGQTSETVALVAEFAGLTTASSGSEILDLVLALPAGPADDGGVL